jgi:hypothetical protein
LNGVPWFGNDYESGSQGDKKLPRSKGFGRFFKKIVAKKFGIPKTIRTFAKH